MSYDSWKLASPDYVEFDYEELAECVVDQLDNRTVDEICADWHADDDREKIVDYVHDIVYDNDLTSVSDALKFLQRG